MTEERRHGPLAVLTGWAVTFPVSLFVGLAGWTYWWDSNARGGSAAFSVLAAAAGVGIALRWGRYAPLMGVLCGVGLLWLLVWMTPPGTD